MTLISFDQARKILEDNQYNPNAAYDFDKLYISLQNLSSVQLALMKTYQQVQLQQEITGTPVQGIDLVRELLQRTYLEVRKLTDVIMQAYGILPPECIQTLPKKRTLEEEEPDPSNKKRSLAPSPFQHLATLPLHPDDHKMSSSGRVKFQEILSYYQIEHKICRAQGKYPTLCFVLSPEETNSNQLKAIFVYLRVEQDNEHFWELGVSYVRDTQKSTVLKCKLPPNLTSKKFETHNYLPKSEDKIGLTEFYLHCLVYTNEKGKWVPYDEVKSTPFKVILRLDYLDEEQRAGINKLQKAIKDAKEPKSISPNSSVVNGNTSN